MKLGRRDFTQVAATISTSLAWGGAACRSRMKHGDRHVLTVEVAEDEVRPVGQSVGRAALLELRRVGPIIGSRGWRRVGDRGATRLAKGVDLDAQYDRVADGLNEPDRKLDQAAVEHAVARPDAVGDVLAKLDADRLDTPLGCIDEHGLDRADGVAVGADHGSALKISG